MKLSSLNIGETVLAKMPDKVDTLFAFDESLGFFWNLMHEKQVKHFQELLQKFSHEWPEHAKFVNEAKELIEKTETITYEWYDFHKKVEKEGNKFVDV